MIILKFSRAITIHFWLQLLVFYSGRGRISEWGLTRKFVPWVGQFTREFGLGGFREGWEQIFCHIAVRSIWRLHLRSIKLESRRVLAI